MSHVRHMSESGQNGHITLMNEKRHTYTDMNETRCVYV